MITKAKCSICGAWVTHLWTHTERCAAKRGMPKWPEAKR